MSRRVVWLQLLIGWLPLWGLFTTLIASAHGIDIVPSALYALRMILAAAALGLVVQRITERYRWPSVVSPKFVIMHLGFAIAYAVAWVIANSIIDSVIHRAIMLNVGGGL